MSDLLAGYRLPIGLFRFRIAPQQPLFVPALNKSNMLRGGFGHAFRRLCCIPQCKDTRSCPLAASCPYKAVFEPSPPLGAESLSKNQDIPRPFVFRAPQSRQTRYERGEPFEFEVVLIGHALDFLPYFVMSFRELAAGGIGLNRAKCNLERVEQVRFGLDAAGSRDCGTEVVYSAADQLFRSTEATRAEEVIKGRFEGRISSQRVTIRFVTPTFLRADGEVIRRPEFDHIFKRLRDRVNALSTFFGNGPLQVDFLDLGTRSENVRTVVCDVNWAERFRTSSKTRQRHELSGFIGEAVYEGELDEFLPWLALGEFVHVGKHAAWGLGHYQLT
jgi:CRISPR/Cas system endoribonuclease Cas6 (RAMP superfamily)